MDPRIPYYTKIPNSKHICVVNNSTIMSAQNSSAWQKLKDSDEAVANTIAHTAAVSANYMSSSAH